LASVDIGWNRFYNNTARFAIHFYDEHACGKITSGSKVHDNYIQDQDAYGIGFVAGCSTGYTWDVGTVDVYNNVCVNCGLNRGGFSRNYTAAVEVKGASLHGTLNFYNNTIYQYARSSQYTSCSTDSTGGFCAGFLNDTAPHITTNWVNNIIVDTAGYNFYYAFNGNNPVAHSNNLYYYIGGSESPPPWDTSSINRDPRFVDPTGGDFSLRSDSLALGAGCGTGLVARDFLGNLRPTPPAIGAFESSSSP
jgi:hypothetical protein